MGKLVNLSGQKFGRWYVLGRAPNKGNCTMWRCRCECGNIRVVEGYSLKSGLSKSCGCLHNELLIERCTKHGCAKQNAKERIYQIWASMKKRCYNPKSQYYYLYGGRGITVCDEWLGEHGAENFVEWALSSGYREDLTLDRKDNNGNYEPSNCRWATQKEQANNKRNNHYIIHNGEKHTIKEWSEIKGLTYSALFHRISRGWNIEEALNAPIKITRKEIS
jgi:hypothetical protein